MICKVCGRNIVNESANFCEYCGASLRKADQYFQENDMNKNQEQQYNQTGVFSQPYHNMPMPNNTEEKEKPISFANWLGSMLLQFIPIVYIIMLFVWAFDNNGNKSKRNWARATLIITAIAFLLLGVLLVNYSSLQTPGMTF